MKKKGGCWVDRVGQLMCVRYHAPWYLGSSVQISACHHGTERSWGGVVLCWVGGIMVFRPWVRREGGSGVPLGLEDRTLVTLYAIGAWGMVWWRDPNYIGWNPMHYCICRFANISMTVSLVTCLCRQFPFLLAVVFIVLSFQKCQEVKKRMLYFVWHNVHSTSYCACCAAMADHTHSEALRACTGKDVLVLLDLKKGRG